MSEYKLPQGYEIRQMTDDQFDPLWDLHASKIFDENSQIFRPFNLSDAKDLQRLASHPKIAETTALIPHPYLDGLAEEWISKQQEWFDSGNSVDFAIELKSINQLSGSYEIHQ